MYLKAAAVHFNPSLELRVISFAVLSMLFGPQLLALANGDRVKDKQRSRSSFIVDMDKKLAAENLLKDLSSSHGALIRQVCYSFQISIYSYSVISEGSQNAFVVKVYSLLCSFAHLVDEANG